MPACSMAAVRHNRPMIIVYGGTILTGERHVDSPAMGLYPAVRGAATCEQTRNEVCTEISYFCQDYLKW